MNQEELKNLTTLIEHRKIIQTKPERKSKNYAYRTQLISLSYLTLILYFIIYVLILLGALIKTNLKQTFKRLVIHDNVF